MSPLWLRSIRRIYRRLHYDWVLAPRGYGEPVELETWEKSYREKSWSFFREVEESGRSMVIAGYVKGLLQRPRVLELGCGAGALAETLLALGASEYVGLDCSEEAVGQASSRGLEAARFEVADFESWQTDEGFDAIVFNDSLYYAQQPVALARRYAEFLHESGWLVVSMHRSSNHALIWKNLESSFQVAHSSTVSCETGDAWDVRVLRPRKSEFDSQRVEAGP